MLLYFPIFTLFSSLLLLSSGLVIFSKNPIYSVLFLIFSFCNASILLFLLQLEFLPIAFLIVYVGAIAVLFLFVLMLLNIKLTELQEKRVNLLPIAYFFAAMFIFELIFILRIDFVPQLFYVNKQFAFLSDYTSSSFFLSKASFSFDGYYNLRSLGFFLFIKSFFHFIISGYILLLAMIGAIVLTLYKKFNFQTQNIFSQILRDFNNSVVYYNRSIA